MLFCLSCPHHPSGQVPIDIHARLITYLVVLGGRCVSWNFSTPGSSSQLESNRSGWSPGAGWLCGHSKSPIALYHTHDTGGENSHTDCCWSVPTYHHLDCYIRTSNTCIHCTPLCISSPQTSVFASSSSRTEASTFPDFRSDPSPYTDPFTDSNANLDSYSIANSSSDTHASPFSHASANSYTHPYSPTFRYAQTLSYT